MTRVGAWVNGLGVSARSGGGDEAIAAAFAGLRTAFCKALSVPQQLSCITFGSVRGFFFELYSVKGLMLWPYESLAQVRPG